MLEYAKPVFLILVSAAWLFTSVAVGEEREESLGAVKIDAFEAEVYLQDVAEDREHLVVTIRGVKPKGSSRVRADRVKVWLLRSNFTAGGPALALEDSPEQLDLPEREVATGIEVNATFKFASRGLRREHMFAVVVAIDDGPKVFKVAQPQK
jgi:hypothetical protein